MERNEDHFQERQNQIKKLEKWSQNTNLNDFSVEDIIQFLDTDKENLGEELEKISKIYFEMVEKAKSEFKIGKYTAMEYTNVIFLRKTEGYDIQSIQKKIKMMYQPLIKPTLSKTAKISILQKTVAKLLQENNKKEVAQSEVIKKLVNSEGFIEDDAKKFINKALKMGILLNPKLDFISL